MDGMERDEAAATADGNSERARQRPLREAILAMVGVWTLTQPTPEAMLELVQDVAGTLRASGAA